MSLGNKRAPRISQYNGSFYFGSYILATSCMYVMLVDLPLVSRPTDGVRLENMESSQHIYASGTFHPDDMAATTITILIPLVAMTTDMTYECDIGVMVRGGKIKSVVREINVTLSGQN